MMPRPSTKATIPLLKLSGIPNSPERVRKLEHKLERGKPKIGAILPLKCEAATTEETSIARS
jgi:hypothetical protein